ncbi:hypothetical protein PCANB_000701 [Pneumocystis canis]|nr:hypothetical protein PCANB_000701 [Pneumocystis canis]
MREKRQKQDENEIDKPWMNGYSVLNEKNGVLEGQEIENKILKRKRQKQKKYSENDAINESKILLNLSAEMQADYMEKKIRELYENYSSLELDDLRISDRYFFEVYWTDHMNLKNLPAFLEQGNLYDPRYVPSPCGSPHTIIFSIAALRVADITRVAKLFAKHNKLKDHINYLAHTRLTIAVGTPGRIMDLIDNEALKVNFLKWIILDTTFADVKKRRFWDMPECWKSLIKLITKDPLKTRLKEGNVKIVYY